MPKSGEHRVNQIDSFFRVRPSSQNIREGENVSFLEDGKLIKQEKRNGIVYEQVYVEQGQAQAAAKVGTSTGDVTNVVISGSSSGGGDVTGITAGNGLIGGGESGNITLNVGAGTGISVSSTEVSIDGTVATLTGTQTLTNKTLSGPKTTGDVLNTGNVSGNTYKYYHSPTDSLGNTAFTVSQSGEVNFAATVELTNSVFAAVSDDGPVVNFYNNTTEPDQIVKLGTIQFSAPVSGSSGSISRLTAAYIEAKADSAFSSSNNQTNLIFYTANNAIADETLRLNYDGSTTFNDAFTFPTADGSANQFLRTNGSGTVSWSNTLVSPTFTGTAQGANLTLTGDLTVGGTTITLNSQNLQVKDKNIVLNYLDGDASSTADGAGITIQDAVNSTTDATILWDATNDEFDFSHAINVTGNISVSGTVDGRDLATDGSKLDGIESNATADQTASEILTAIKTVDGATSGLDSDLLDGQHGSYYLDFGNFVIDDDEIPIAKLASDSVSYGGVSVTLGSSDATPAFNLSDATSLPIVAGTSGTLSVARGGTGATTLTSNSLLTGNGTSAIQAESYLTFDGNHFEIENSSNGRGVQLNTNSEIKSLDGASWLHLQRYVDGNVAIGNNSNADLYVANQLGIGTSSPSEKLHIYGSVDNDDVAVHIQNAFDDNSSATPPSAALTFTTASNNAYLRVFGAPADTADNHKIELGSTAVSSYITFKPSNSEAMRIGSSGNVGINEGNRLYFDGTDLSLTQDTYIQSDTPDNLRLVVGNRNMIEMIEDDTQDMVVIGNGMTDVDFVVEDDAGVIVFKVDAETSNTTVTGDLDVTGALTAGTFNPTTVSTTNVIAENYKGTGGSNPTAFTVGPTNGNVEFLNNVDINGGNFTLAKSNGSILNLTTTESDIINNEPIGTIKFYATNETGTAANQLAASIVASASGTFDTSNNPTDMVFSLGATGTATEKMRINSSGNVGIGTQSPTFSFGTRGIEIEALGQNPALRLDRSDNVFEITTRGADTLVYSMSNLPVRFGQNGGERFRLTSTGVVINEDGASRDFRVEGDTYTDLFFVDGSADRIGIGTTSPGALLDVVGTGYIRTAVFSDAFKPYSGTLATYGSSSSTDHYFVGDVGIGTNSPGYKLDVAGDINLSGNLRKGGLAMMSIDASYTTILKPSGTVGIYLGQSDAANYYDNTRHRFRPSGGGSTYYMTVSTGGLGISRGSDDAEAKLHIGDADNDNNALASNVLGTTSGDSIDYIKLECDSTNANQLIFSSERIADGSTWTTTRERIYRRVDISDMGYIQFGSSFDTTNAHMISFGEIGVGDYMGITGGGRVGIGNTSPVALLDVGGDTDEFALIGRARVGFNSHSDYASFQHRDSATSTGYALLQHSGGTTYLNTTGSMYFRVNNVDKMRLDSSGNFRLPNDGANFYIGDNDELRLLQSGSNSYLYSYTNTLYVGAVTSNYDTNLRAQNASGSWNALQVDSSVQYVRLPNDNWRLSIGLGNDLGLYHDATNSWIRNFTGNLYIRNDTHGGDIYMGAENDSGSIDYTFTLDGTNRRIGIGNTSPTSKLHVKDATDISMDASGNGQVRVEGNGYALGIALNGSGAFIYQNSSARFMAFGNNETEQVRLTTAGALHVDNDVVAFSTTPSDIKLKTNIQDIDYGLDTIMKLNPKQYDWKEDNRHDIGFIAQEVEEVIPEIVKDNEWFDDKIKTLDYEKLTAVLIKAVQEQQEQINKLEEQLNG